MTQRELFKDTEMENIPEATILDQEDNESLRTRISTALAKIDELEATKGALQSSNETLKSELSQRPTQEELSEFRTKFLELETTFLQLQKSAKQFSEYATEKIEKQTKELSTLRVDLSVTRLEKRTLLAKHKEALEIVEKYKAAMKQLEKKAKSNGDFAAFVTVLGVLGIASKL